MNSINKNSNAMERCFFKPQIKLKLINQNLKKMNQIFSSF